MRSRPTPYKHSKPVVTYPHSGALYRVVQRDDSTFGVSVSILSIPGMYPAMVTGFTSRAAAKQWIARYKDTVAEGDFMTRRRFHDARNKTAQ
jgi:hypothetical protein